jgi:hypothetical protein
MSDESNWPGPVLKLIEQSHSREVMERVCDYDPDDRAFEILTEMSRGMLAACKPEGSSCVIMSALLAECLSDPLGLSVPVVAGALKLGSDYMYGGNRPFDGRQVFSANGEDWDGHCWLLFGRYIVDVSLGRTARRGECKASLSRAVIGTFGEHVGMIAVTEAGARKANLRYLPRYVLTPDQVLALSGGAMQKFGL